MTTISHDGLSIRYIPLLCTPLRNSTSLTAYVSCSLCTALHRPYSTVRMKSLIQRSSASSTDEKCGGVCLTRSRQVLTEPLNPERHLFETSHHRRRPAATCSGQSGRFAALTCVQVLSCDRYLTGISRDSFVTAYSRSLL
jgi:hypothetical protein